MTRHPIIAVDGPAASGKGTLAARLAAELGVPHLDTGLLYRAVARRLADAGTETEDAAIQAACALTPADLARTDLRTPDMDSLTSRVSAWPGLRAALLDRQRDFARATGAVIDGRDIGTVVFPDADAKLFVTASSGERARRRLLQRRVEITQAALAAERAAIEARDAADEARAAAPLREAPDADRIDTTALDAEQAFTQALALVRARLGV
jgi:cytidylate kinase